MGGSNVDFEALRSAIASRHVGAVLDVWDEGCWHFPDYSCGSPYGQPAFPHHEQMGRKDGSGALVLPGLTDRDKAFWEGSVKGVAENLAAFIDGQPLKNIVRNGTASIML